MVVTSIDGRIDEVLRRLPRILRSDRAPSAVLGEVATLARELFGTHLAVAAFLDDDRSLGLDGLLRAPRPSTSRPCASTRRSPRRSPRCSPWTPRCASTRTPGTRARSTTMPRPRPVDRQPARRPAPVGLPHGRCAVPRPPTRTGAVRRGRRAPRSTGSAALSARPSTTRCCCARRCAPGAGCAPPPTLTQQLLADELPEPLKVIAERAMELADADRRPRCCSSQDDHLVVRHVTGLSHLAQFRGREFPLDGSITAAGARRRRADQLPRPGDGAQRGARARSTTASSGRA